MTLFGQGIRVTQAIYEDHILVEGGYVFAGPAAYRIICKTAMNDNGKTYLDAYDRSLRERRSVKVCDGEMPSLLRGV